MYPALKNIFALAGRSVIDILYPCPCIACGDSTGRTINILCDYCLATLPQIRRSDTVLALDGGVPGGGRLTILSGLWLYNAGSVTGHIQKQLKYGNRPGLGLGLGQMMAAVVKRNLAHLSAPYPDVVIPVPLARVRRLERGYNQAGYLARGVGLGLFVPVKTLLRKEPGVRPQTGLSRPERMLNLESAFTMLPDHSVKGQTVLVVDDVWTTGATICSVAETLLCAGAASVCAVVLAVTLHS